MIFRLTRNWSELLGLKLSRQNWEKVKLRQGITISASPNAHLNFLFHEIWIDRVYGEVPKGTVIDLGANIGVFSLFAALNGATVYAFEPGPSADYFEQNTKDLPNIHFTRKAVTGDGRNCFLDVSKDPLFNSLSDDGIPVESLTLDSILEDIPECDLLKVDVEGSEWEILSNCKQLSKVKRIVGEIDSHGDELVGFLKDQGFEVRTNGAMFYAE